MQLGKYTIHEKIGEGATAIVYHATDITLGREVALKQLRPALVADEMAFSRFQEEAKTAAVLFHQYIATVLDIAESEGYFYIVMRYIKGKSLDKVIQEEGRQPWQDVLLMIEQVSEVLELAHNQGFLHRDIKPSNIIRTEDGCYVVTDFGLSKAMMTSGFSSHTSDMVGTPEYMAPELWEDKASNPATDQYALACVAFEMLIGKALFHAENTPAVMLKHFKPIEMPSQWPKDVPETFQQVLSRALDKQYENRYRSMAELVQSVHQIEPPALPHSDPEPEDTESRFQHKPKRILVWISVAVLLILGSLALFFTREAVLIPVINRFIHREKVRQQDGMLQVYVPSGPFIMGSDDFDWEKPAHRVFLDGFWIDAFTVTNAQYALCVAADACSEPQVQRSLTRESYYGSNRYANFPVVYVNWHDAQGYCEWVGGTLPTEAQWEKAARGRDGRIYPWGNAAPTCSLGNFNDCQDDTTPVNSYPNGASPYGVMNMAGNVLEWVADWYDPNYYSREVVNPTGPEQRYFRVSRGSNWSTNEANLRITRRYSNFPQSTNSDLGFRCVTK